MALAAILALTGCVEEAPGTSEQMPAVGTFLEGTSEASDAATTACRDLLASQTTGGVRVVCSEVSQAASTVYMRVGPNCAPWSCLVGNDGRDPSITFVGREGAL